MTTKLRIGVIFGGRSGEHEVSVRSARSVIDAIDKSKYEVVPIAITKEGNWLAPPVAAALLPSETQYASDRMREPIPFPRNGERHRRSEDHTPELQPRPQP